MTLERIPDFLERLSDIPADADWRRFWSLALNEVKHLKTAPRTPPGAVAPVRGYAMTTVRSVLSDYRNAVRADRRFGPNHIVLKYLKPSLDDQEAVKELGVERVYAANTERRPIDPEALVDVALAMLDDPRSMAQAAGLLLLTGRRNTEIFRGSFSLRGRRKSDPIFAEYADGFTIIFDGQLKTKDAATAQTSAYEIPVLAEADRIIHAINRLRTEKPVYEDKVRQFPDFDDTQINKKIDSAVASSLGERVVERLRDDAGGTLTPKDLRAIYATIAYEWFAPPAFSLNAYFAQILGHSEGDLETSMSYNRFYVVGHKRDYDRAFRKASIEAIGHLERKRTAEMDAARVAKIDATIARYKANIPESY